MHNFFQVNILESYCYLSEDEMSMPFGQIGCSTSFLVLHQVAPICIFSDQVCDFFRLKSVNDTKHISALLAAPLGIVLRDLEESFSAPILHVWDAFDDHVEASDATLIKADTAAVVLEIVGQRLVLIQL